MAKIVQLGHDSASRNRSKVTDVHCLWEEGQLDTGEPCIILRTFNPHAKQGTVNQVLHITPEIAAQLVDILNTKLLNVH